MLSVDFFQVPSNLYAELSQQNESSQKSLIYKCLGVASPAALVQAASEEIAGEQLDNFKNKVESCAKERFFLITLFVRRINFFVDARDDFAKEVAAYDTKRTCLKQIRSSFCPFVRDAITERVEEKGEYAEKVWKKVLEKNKANSVTLNLSGYGDMFVRWEKALEEQEKYREKSDALMQEKEKGVDVSLEAEEYNLKIKLDSLMWEIEQVLSVILSLEKGIKAFEARMSQEFPGSSEKIPTLSNILEKARKVVGNRLELFELKLKEQQTEQINLTLKSLYKYDLECEALNHSTNYQTVKKEKIELRQIFEAIKTFCSVNEILTHKKIMNESEEIIRKWNKL